MKQSDIFEGAARRLQMNEAIDMTQQSLQAYGAQHEHWYIAWSGGKDSTLVVTMTAWLIEAGMIPKPKSLTVLYADTRMELPPLWLAAQDTIDRLGEMGIAVKTVMAPMDKRFMVYLLGRGVPPPNNGTFRWCTRQIKIDPMEEAIRELLDRDGSGLILTGVRIGESAIRDRRILLACSKDGSECGQGWYQKVVPQAKGIKGRVGTLAPVLHWRVCHVWRWLRDWAPQADFGDWDTQPLADAYGGDEAEEINARTGCTGCPLASQDKALEAIVKQPAWEHLKPLLELRPIYRRLREPHNRLRKTGIERRLDGQIVKNNNRMGPLTMEARLAALEDILDIQRRVNAAGVLRGHREYLLINAEEEGRIRELIAANTWPQKWNGTEQRGHAPFDEYHADGSVQSLLL